MTRSVLWVGSHRVTRDHLDLGFGKQRQSDGALVVGLGPLGVFRYHKPGHRVVFRQPIFKKV